MTETLKMCTFICSRSEDPLISNLMMVDYSLVIYSLYRIFAMSEPQPPMFLFQDFTVKL